MSNEVYANGMEVACKAAQGKSICAFPDVCLTPPAPPAGPIPIPYPNTGMASDTDGGSKTVQISGKEVMLKDSSSFKKSTGDEAATKAQGMNVITHQIQGKVYFTSWSMDVKIEGENAVRHLDMMTHNHASGPGGTPPWPYVDAMAMAPGGVCASDPDPECKLVPYNEGCPGGKTPHHVIPVHCFMGKGMRSKPKAERVAGTFSGAKDYDPAKAPCVCVDGHTKTPGSMHGKMHAAFDAAEDAHLASTNPRTAGSWTYDQASDAGAKSVAGKDLGNGKTCSEACVKHQLDNYHKDKTKINGSTPLRADSSGQGTPSGFVPSVTAAGMPS